MPLMASLVGTARVAPGLGPPLALQSSSLSFGRPGEGGSVLYVTDGILPSSRSSFGLSSRGALGGPAVDAGAGAGAADSDPSSVRGLFGLLGPAVEAEVCTLLGLPMNGRFSVLALLDGGSICPIIFCRSPNGISPLLVCSIKTAVPPASDPLISVLSGRSAVVTSPPDAPRAAPALLGDDLPDDGNDFSEPSSLMTCIQVGVSKGEGFKKFNLSGEAGGKFPTLYVCEHRLLVFAEQRLGHKCDEGAYISRPGSLLMFSKLRYAEGR